MGQRLPSIKIKMKRFASIPFHNKMLTTDKMFFSFVGLLSALCCVTARVMSGKMLMNLYTKSQATDACKAIGKQIMDVDMYDTPSMVKFLEMQKKSCSQTGTEYPYSVWIKNYGSLGVEGEEAILLTFKSEKVWGPRRPDQGMRYPVLCG